MWKIEKRRSKKWSLREGALEPVKQDHTQESERNVVLNKKTSSSIWGVVQVVTYKTRRPALVGLKREVVFFQGTNMPGLAYLPGPLSVAFPIVSASRVNESVVGHCLVVYLARVCTASSHVIYYNNTLTLQLRRPFDQILLWLLHSRTCRQMWILYS